ncbi:triose-phosphate isomerase [Stappia sp. ES.058]|uniref:triose-phosphate isomerase n=1 Tax=Stappia sp. ES.058 TaxID=1881061 RepID=UPI000B890DE1|nr:triose-phosphate isomerase [Stappia sp. ES.058]
MSKVSKPLVAGNWKMNGLGSALEELIRIADDVRAGKGSADVAICPPATMIAAAVQKVFGSGVQIGGQDCHAAASGAHTGDIAAEMLADAGASYVIVGHSERRADHGEDNATVNAKACAAWRAGLTAIVCVGETQAERKAGEALAVVGRQLEESVPEGATPETLVIAYEPVWAIGTGLTPTVDDVAEMHAFMRGELVQRFGEAFAAVRLLYGGSVKAGNAVELLGIADVDGALVGGASLKAADFLPIVAAAG